MTKNKKTWLVAGAFRSFREALAQAADQLYIWADRHPDMEQIWG